MSLANKLPKHLGLVPGSGSSLAAGLLQVPGAVVLQSVQTIMSGV